MTPEELDRVLQDIEGENLEFKEARNNYSFNKLVCYCAALANEGGGKVILGVRDRRPRKVLGSNAFPQIERTRASLLGKIPLRIEVGVVQHSRGRVLVFDIPSRPLGTPMKADGIYWMRHGDSLVSMSEDKLRAILAETGRDFSAEACPSLRLDDLMPEAIEDFRRVDVPKLAQKPKPAPDYPPLREAGDWP